jgi:hypothetical protein
VAKAPAAVDEKVNQKRATAHYNTNYRNIYKGQLPSNEVLPDSIHSDSPELLDDWLLQ